MPMSKHWAYNPYDIYKTPGELIHDMVKVRAKGGNFILNVGPKANGELPLEQVNILIELASWNMTNGDAIHGIRPWKISNQNNVWFTYDKGNNIIYAIFLEWPQKKQVKIKALNGTKVTGVSMLGLGEKLEWNTEEGLVVKFPEMNESPCKYAYTLRIRIE